MPSIRFIPEQLEQDDTSLQGRESFSRYSPERVREPSIGDESEITLTSFSRELSNGVDSEITLDFSNNSNDPSLTKKAETERNILSNNELIEINDSEASIEIEREIASDEIIEKKHPEPSIDPACERKDTKTVNFTKNISNTVSEETKFDKSVNAQYNMDDDKNGNRLISRRTVIMLDVFCVMIFALGAFVIFYFAGNKDSNNLFNKDDHPRTSSDQNILRQSSLTPPMNVARLCDSRFISTSYDGFTLCKNACMVAKCCSFTDDSLEDETCINDENNNITCGWYYEPCKPIFNSAMEGSEIIANTMINDSDEKDSMSNLENICSEENMIEESNRDLCFEACLPARCCFMNIDTCATNDDVETWCKMFSQCVEVFNFDAMN